MAAQPDLCRTTWRKSRHSMANGNCVEAAPGQDGIVVRDSANRLGEVLRYSARVWRDFIADAKAGKFDVSAD